MSIENLSDPSGASAYHMMIDRYPTPLTPPTLADRPGTAITVEQLAQDLLAVDPSTKDIPDQVLGEPEEVPSSELSIYKQLYLILLRGPRCR